MGFNVITAVLFTHIRRKITKLALNFHYTVHAHKFNSHDLYAFFKQVELVAKGHDELIAYFMSNTAHSTLYIKVKQILKNTFLEWVNQTATNSVSNDYLAEFVVSGILATYVQWNNRNKDIPNDELNEILTKLCASTMELIK